ncbi:apoptosis-associated speck-like protein containing a CARD [Xiphias gladius]|uniref:apoptosis-associated speck-like protein containing a CARD n=1 Tax=Xiphias gladius TaxID=8245 RepID=UPI001A99AA92|nr:apoptosis-associated speck-like protein containing a CARD [Xiphias gladius]
MTRTVQSDVTFTSGYLRAESSCPPPRAAPTPKLQTPSAVGRAEKCAPAGPIRTALANALEDLSAQNFEKFRHRLVDRREEPRVRRARVEGKNFLDVTDVLVSTFTEAGALRVAAEILRAIDCHEEAEELVRETTEMATNTIKTALANALEDLSAQNFEKFRHRLVDRREEPRVRRARVEGKNFLDVTDVLVSTFTEAGALRVAAEILRAIDCHEEAEELAKKTGGQSSKPGSSDNKHFVDKHRLQLINRVSNVAPILDELLDSNVIQQESYDTIRALSTCQEKIRAIYAALKAGESCKDIFYDILKKNDPYLIADLQGNK